MAKKKTVSSSWYKTKKKGQKTNPHKKRVNGAYVAITLYINGVMCQ